MGLILTVTAGFVVWIVLWALGDQAGRVPAGHGRSSSSGRPLKILSGYLPGRRS